MSLKTYISGIRSDDLLRTAVNHIYLFQDQNGCMHAITTVGSKCSLTDVNKETISRWLRRLFLATHHSTFSPSVIDKIAAYIIALSEDDDIPEQPYFTRVGQIEKTCYYNLGGKDQKIVVVSRDGVEIKDNANFQICFQSAKPQVTPNLNAQPQQLIELLKPFFRLKSQEDFLLLIIYITTCFICNINHPILIFHGSEGSSKSSSVDAIGKIVDPHGTANRLTMNPDRRSMVAALSHRYFLGFDNLDVALKKWQSDLLCNACTGGSEPMRILYETNSLQEANIKGCVCLNGLTVVATERDLLDRGIILELTRIPDKEYLTEEEINSRFSLVLPDILGSIFNTLYQALNMIDTVKHYPRSRMQDFCKWGYCIAEVIGELGDTFSKEYALNKLKSQQEAKLPLIVDCLVSFMKYQHAWSGNMTELRDSLWTVAKQRGYKDIQFPASASALSRLLTYYKKSLEQEGIFYSQHSNGDRKLQIINQNSKNSDTLKLNGGNGDNGDISF